MFSDKIRIRLKAYDSRILDQSTGEIVDTAKRAVRDPHAQAADRHLRADAADGGCPDETGSAGWC
jgi:hypothetical protein